MFRWSLGIRVHERGGVILTWGLGLAFLVMVFVAGSLGRRFDSYMSPVTVVGVSAFFYVVAIPLEVVATGVPVLRLHSPVWIPAEVPNEAILSAMVAYTAFCSGYWLVVNRGRVVTLSLASATGVRAAQVVTGVCSLMLGALLVLVYPNELLSSRDYASMYSQKFTSPIFALVSQYWGIAFAMHAFLHGADATRRFAVARCIGYAALLGVWGVYSNSKLPIVLGGLALSSLLLRGSNRAHPARFACSLLAVPGLLAVATVLFSLNRGGGSLDLRAQVRHSGLLTAVEPAGPYYSLVLELKRHGSSVQGFAPWESVVQSSLTWIPQTLWSGRPTDIALAFARQRIPDWAPGYGYGYSPLAEGYFQAGLLGVVMLFLLFGLLVAAIRNGLVRLRDRAPEQGPLLLSALFVGLLYFCFVIFRGPFQLFITNLVQSSGLIALMLAISIATRSMRTRRRNFAMSERG